MAHILIVEDTPDNRTIAELILQRVGHTVVSVDNGISALHLAARAQPDIILMDLSLPTLDGWETTRRLKSNPTTRSIPVIAFTAHTLESDIDHALAVGCATVISKPFEIDGFLHQINMQLGLHIAEQTRRVGV